MNHSSGCTLFNLPGAAQYLQTINDPVTTRGEAGCPGQPANRSLHRRNKYELVISALYITINAPHPVHRPSELKNRRNGVKRTIHLHCSTIYTGAVMRNRTSIQLLLLSAAIACGTTIVVPDQSPGIQSAIEKAENGDTVFIRTGTFRESITLKDNISLVGESMTATVIRGDRKQPVVKASDNSLLKNFTVTRGSVGILCENVAFTIEQVIVTKNHETGIHCLITLPNIYNCVISRNTWTGIFCESTRSIKTSIIHNIIAENGYCGIMLQGQSEVLIQNNVFVGNRQYGVWGVAEARRTRIVYNNFFNNRSAVNVYLKKDISNTSNDPGYPRIRGRYDFFSTSSVLLKGRGKDGATIGLVGGEVLTKKLTDPDEDEVGVNEDRCPSIPEDHDGFEDGDGCPEFDNDKDGIFDTEDACPNSPEDYDGFRDDDGCFDFDNDKDGIPDSIDVCRDNPETLNGFKDADGCPDLVLPGETDVPATDVPATDDRNVPEEETENAVKKAPAGQPEDTSSADMKLPKPENKQKEHDR